jgi:hypothetical protein
MVRPGISVGGLFSARLKRVLDNSYFKIGERVRPLFFLMSMILAASFPNDAGATDLRPVAFSTTEYALRVNGREGGRFLSAREMIMDITFPSGRKDKGDMLVVFDQASGLYLWMFQLIPPDSPASGTIASSFDSRFVPFATTEKLAVFWIQPPEIVVIDSEKKAASLGDAEKKSLAEALELVGDFENRSFWRRLPRASFGSLDSSFFAPQFSSAWLPIALLSVERSEAGWEVLVEGQWRARLSLNRKYELIGTARVK